MEKMEQKKRGGGREWAYGRRGDAERKSSCLSHFVWRCWSTKAKKSQTHYSSRGIFNGLFFIGFWNLNSCVRGILPPPSFFSFQLLRPNVIIIKIKKKRLPITRPFTSGPGGPTEISLIECPDRLPYYYVLLKKNELNSSRKHLI